MRIVPKQGVWTRDTNNTVVTLAEMKSVCYVDTVLTDDDDMFVSMELAARNLCEQFLGRPLLTANQTLYYPYTEFICWIAGEANPIVNLPGGKLQAIDSVSVWDEDDVEEVVDTTTYQNSITGEQAQVYFKETPFSNTSSSYRELDALQITTTGGFGDTTSSVPDEIKQGILFLIAYWYEHREDQKIGNTITSSAKASWSPWKLQRFK